MPVTASEDGALRKTLFRGCLFCRTGREKNVVRQLELLIPCGRAISPVKTRFRREGGKAREEAVSLLPGYVFFEASGDLSLRRISGIEGVLKPLAYADGDWRLHGADDQFAAMLFREDGRIARSQAFFDEGDRIRIVEGFMKAYEGSIVRVNRRAKTAEVRIPFQDKQISMWLGYELIARAAPDGAVDA